MSAELVSSALGRTGSWAGRASQHRRRQVGSRATGTAPGLDDLWATVVEVLDAVPGQAGAVLCTMSGASVVSHGLSRNDQLRMPRAARRLLASNRVEDGGTGDVVTTELTAGTRCTVVARIPSAAHGDHLLLVTAAGVSAPLLHAWTSRAAEDLRDLLSVAAG